MVERDKVTEALAALEDHLDVYGPNAERWTEAARNRFEPVIAGEPRARALLAEARALETVLERAPVVDPAKFADLSNRIVAAAAAAGGPASSPVVVDLQQARRTREVGGGRQHGLGADWRVATALAASLVLGIYLGASPGVVSAVETIASSVGISDAGEDDVALFDENESEELL